MFELVRPPVPHEPGPGHLDDVHIGHADDDCRPDGGHQGEGVSPGVTKLLHHVNILTIQPGHTPQSSDITMRTTKPCQDSSCHVKCHARLDFVGCRMSSLEENSHEVTESTGTGELGF